MRIARQPELNAVRVEKVASKLRHACNLGRRPVESVTHYRVSYGRKMNSDLMSPASADPHLEVSELLEAPQYRVLRPRRAAVRQPCGHPDAAHRVARNRPLDAVPILLHHTVHQR